MPALKGVIESLEKWDTGMILVHIGGTTVSVPKWDVGYFEQALNRAYTNHLEVAVQYEEKPSGRETPWRNLVKLTDGEGAVAEKPHRAQSPRSSASPTRQTAIGNAAAAKNASIRAGNLNNTASTFLEAATTIITHLQTAAPDVPLEEHAVQAAGIVGGLLFAGRKLAADAFDEKLDEAAFNAWADREELKKMLFAHWNVAHPAQPADTTVEAAGRSSQALEQRTRLEQRKQKLAIGMRQAGLDDDEMRTFVEEQLGKPGQPTIDCVEEMDTVETAWGKRLVKGI